MGDKNSLIYECRPFYSVLPAVTASDSPSRTQNDCSWGMTKSPCICVLFGYPACFIPMATTLLLACLPLLPKLKVLSLLNIQEIGRDNVA
jgi:hypothetical protein